MVEPGVVYRNIARANADVAGCGTGKLPRARPGRIGKVEKEAQSLLR